MTIKKKLILSTSAVFLILLSIGITLLFGYRYVTGKASIANELDKESMFLQMILRGVNEVIITEGTPASVEIAEEGLKGFDDIHTRLLKESHDSDIHEVITEKIDPQWQRIKEDIKPFLEHDLDVEAEGLMIKYGKAITETGVVINNIKALSEKTRAVVNSNSAKSDIVQKIIIFSIISILTAFVFLSYQIYRSITLPIRELSTLAKGFKNGDLSITMDESKKNEFGILASHFNIATAKLSTMVSNVKSSTDTLASSSQNLSASITQIAANTREQSSQTTQAASATEELNTSFQDVAGNTVNAAESAQNAAGLAVKGGEVVNKTVNGMNMIAESVKESALSIEALGKNSEKVGEIVKVISDIAGQTNLLALNAAIEAARAGEQGRGFAVVADEVKKLAEKTTSATNEIVDMISSIQEDTNKSVESMQSGTKEVEAGVELANQAGEALQKIVTSVQNVTDLA